MRIGRQEIIYGSGPGLMRPVWKIPGEAETLYQADAEQEWTKPA
ncbi:hypothetical protein B932_0714 [Gluconobacter oxydans H24]|nr:hypothetical protein B932_0714 [Gluconobacter oxydans H24]